MIEDNLILRGCGIKGLSLRGAVLILALFYSGLSRSQTAGTTPTLPGAGAPQTGLGAPVHSPGVASPPELRAILDTARVRLEGEEAAFKRPDLSRLALGELRSRIDPITEELRELVSSLTPRIDAARGRLDQLGPKPKDGSPGEGSDVVRDRAERETAVAQLDDSQRLGKALLLQAEQLTSQIGERRRADVSAALFERSYGPFSPQLWSEAARALPRDVRALQFGIDDLASRISARASPFNLALLALAIGVALALHFARERLAPRLLGRDPRALEVPHRKRVRRAGAIVLIEALPAIVGSLVVYQALQIADVLPPRWNGVAGAILLGLAFLACVDVLLDALLAPGRPAWRLVTLPDGLVGRITRFAWGFATIAIAGRVFAAINDAIAASPPLMVMTRIVVAIAAAAILAEALRRLATRVAADEACLGPYVPTEPEIGGPVRVVGWLVVVAIVTSVVTGYIAFASFLVEQVLWTGLVGALLWLGWQAGDELIAGTLRGDTRIATALQANTGLRRRSLEQLGVLGSGIARVVLLIAALLLILAPWGIESGDVAATLRTAFFGFRIGDITISLSTIVVALVLFALVLALTRIVQGWLDKALLPTTSLDAGIRNSITTAAGYVGFFAAAALGLSYLGLGIEKIALVAGALSVGIGFGLQSIVNNFVSGLILLWERPIRVGDLVVVADNEGYVRRISVRATEIETLDRSTVIVPNSNLISGIVRNRVRGDRSGRIVLSISVLRDRDPARVADLLAACAARHPDIALEPPPKVLFRKIGDTTLDFDLVAVVEDVTAQLRVQSELNFSLFSTMIAEHLLPPLGPNVMVVDEVGETPAALRAIAEALKGRPAAGAGAPAGAQAPDPPDATASNRPEAAAPR